MLPGPLPEVGRLCLALRNFSGLPTAFWIKLVAVVALTIAFGITFAESRRPGPPKLAPKLGPATGLLALVSIIFAVVAFE